MLPYFRMHLARGPASIVFSLAALLLSSCSARSVSHADDAGSGRAQHASTSTFRAPKITTPPAFVIFVEGKPHLVVAQTVQPSWTRGAPKLVRGEAAWTAEKDIATDVLPESLRSRETHSFSLMGVRGVLCTAEVRGDTSAPRALARLAADGPTTEATHEERDAVAQGKRIWESETSDHLVVRPLVPVRGDCASALYAKAAEDTRTWATASAPTGPQEEVARSAFRALPQYRAQKDGDTDVPNVLPTVRTFDVGTARYYFVSEGEESSCDAPRLGALFYADRTETPRELGLVAVSGDMAGEAALLVHDAGTGDVHVLYGDFELPIRKGHEPDPRRTVRVPFEGCGC